jgi:hypothetical protein
MPSQILNGIKAPFKKTVTFEVTVTAEADTKEILNQLICNAKDRLNVDDEIEDGEDYGSVGSEIWVVDKRKIRVS